MRQPLLLMALIFLVLPACSSPSEPEQRSIIGQWVAVGPEQAEITMTLTEIARNVSGAGSWVLPTVAYAFRAEGAHANGTVSLLLDFDEMADVNFLGEFTDEDTMEGVLSGNGLLGVPVVFERVVDPED